MSTFPDSLIDYYAKQSRRALRDESQLKMEPLDEGSNQISAVMGSSLTKNIDVACKTEPTSTSSSTGLQMKATRRVATGEEANETSGNDSRTTNDNHLQEQKMPSSHRQKRARITNPQVDKDIPAIDSPLLIRQSSIDRNYAEKSLHNSTSQVVAPDLTNSHSCQPLIHFPRNMAKEIPTHINFSTLEYFCPSLAARFSFPEDSLSARTSSQQLENQQTISGRPEQKFSPRQKAIRDTPPQMGSPGEIEDRHSPAPKTAEARTSGNMFGRKPPLTLDMSEAASYAVLQNDEPERRQLKPTKPAEDLDQDNMVPMLVEFKTGSHSIGTGIILVSKNFETTFSQLCHRIKRFWKLSDFKKRLTLDSEDKQEIARAKNYLRSHKLKYIEVVWETDSITFPSSIRNSGDWISVSKMLAQRDWKDHLVAVFEIQDDSRHVENMGADEEENVVLHKST